jgi:hypothetical protein
MHIRAQRDEQLGASLKHDLDLCLVANSITVQDNGVQEGYERETLKGGLCQTAI